MKLLIIQGIITIRYENNTRPRNLFQKLECRVPFKKDNNSGLSAILRTSTSMVKSIVNFSTILYVRIVIVDTNTNL